MKTLQDLFLDELADMYDSENRITKALPKFARAAAHSQLTEAFESHLRQTEGHVKKLEQIFTAFGAKPRSKKCDATVGLLEEGRDLVYENKGEPTIDAALISAGQKMEHYEIASYGCLTEWARLLGNQEAEQLLAEILGEEKAADQTLTTLARSVCNETAKEGDTMTRLSGK